MLMAKLKNEVLKVIMTIWCAMVIIFSGVSQGFATNVANWGQFIAGQQVMLEKLFTSVIIPELVNRLIDEIFKIKVVDGVLTRIPLTTIQQNLSRETITSLNRIYDVYSSLKADWYSNYFCSISSVSGDLCKKKSFDNVINVLNADSEMFQNEVAKTMFLIDGDMGYVNAAFSDLQKIKDKIPDSEYKKLSMKIAELQYAKENLANNVLSYAAYVKRSSEYNKAFRNFDSAIANASSYSSEQAKKDLLKTQILNTLQLIDYARFIAESNLRKIAVKNVELNKERERLVNEMIVYKNSFPSKQ